MSGTEHAGLQCKEGGASPPVTSAGRYGLTLWNNGMLQTPIVAHMLHAPEGEIVRSEHGGYRCAVLS